MANLVETQGVAIVGLACRAAGTNDTPEKLWQFLLDRKHASGEVPAQRWEPWRRRDPRNGKILDNIIRKGYFLEDLQNVDAAFFGISPKEAELMDPHQRLALELTWEALENAGIDPKSLAGTDTAVYMGVDSDDYSRMSMEDLPNIEAWSGIGTAAHGIPNRISYHLDLQGPSTAVDAACASSLIAIHLARQAILSGESTVAICGGVNVICALGLTHMLHKAGALSPGGVCRSFDDEACGYARGEGGATIVLKRLDAAIADGDNIFAVLKGTASAQDGKTNGIMAPKAAAQKLVARQAFCRSGDMDPLTNGYVEAHATSTALGDPTEISAIAKVYGAGRPKDEPCFVGSIKPNVGHLEAAAGAIGFIKAVLSVNKGMIAPQTLLGKLNTKVDWNTSGLDVVREQKQLPVTDTSSLSPRRAAVYCYGYGGSVCHAIIEQTPPSCLTEASNIGSPWIIPSGNELATLVISAQQKKRLNNQASELANWLSNEGRSESLFDILRTLAQRRAAHDYRASFVVANHNEAVQALISFADGKASQWSSCSRVYGGERSVVWVFSGHGAQWNDMGKELLQNSVFHAAIAELDDILDQEAGFSVLEALERGDLAGSDRVQVLTYAMQIGLTALLKSNGVEPQAIIGHSVGEIAASVAAGCLTPREGAVIVAGRAKLYAQVAGKGSMALISLPFQQVADELAGRKDLVAAINSSPSSCVVSGETAALDEYVALLNNRGVKTFRVQTDIAFHSPMLDRLVEPLRQALDGCLNPQPAYVPVYSTSQADPRTNVLRNTEYWIHNMIAPVELVNAVNASFDDGHRMFLEVSSHPIVSHSISDVLQDRSDENSAAFGIMRRKEPVHRSISQAVSRLFTLGVDIDFSVQQGSLPWCTTVPNTPWVHKPYWKSISEGPESCVQQHDVDQHTLLGGVTEIAGSTTKVWSTILDDTNKPYPLSHPLDATEIIPAAVYCNTIRKATGATILDDLVLKVPTPMTADKREVQVVVQDNSIGILSRLRGSGKSSDLRSRIPDELPTGFAWAYLQKIGVSGIAFPWTVLEHYSSKHEMLVRMDMDPASSSLSWDQDSWAPFLDAATSVGSSIFHDSIRLRIVSGIDQVLFLSEDAPPKIGWLLIANASEGEKLRADISVLGEDGTLLAKVNGMRFSDVEAVDDRSTGTEALVHRLAWVPPVFSETPRRMDRVVLISQDTQLLATYTTVLEAAGQKVVCVSSSEDLKQEIRSKALSRSAYQALIHDMDQVANMAHAHTWEAASILKILATVPSAPKLFVIAHQLNASTALAHAPLQGFARCAASEYFNQWGGLINCETKEVPLLALKYVQDASVVRIQDGLPRIPRMRPFTESHLQQDTTQSLMPKPHGTYLVTGGFGDLGLEVLDFLVQKGARRIIVISRQSLPPRRDWPQVSGRVAAVVEKIQKLESMGATIHAIALDIGSPSASTEIVARLNTLNLPPVLGVVHAAGISLDGFIKDTTSELFAEVMISKVQGALTLHITFAPGSLDFMVLFSSIGQLLGTPGQAAYASANAFLDALATQRRSGGCNTIAIQWTAWRNMGLARDNSLLEMELGSQGVTDITVEEAFQAWEHLSKYDTDHAVVTRTLILDVDEPLPCALIADIVQRRARCIDTPALSESPSSAASTTSPPTPRSGSELKDHLSSKIRQCLSTVLHLDVEDIDDRAAIADLGVDSVMTVSLRQQLQKAMGVKVPPTLTWSYPTVGHLAGWFYEQLAE